jgi:two-component system chemotaxis sensor kinase CheA
MLNITNDQELMRVFYQETQNLIEQMSKDISSLGEEQDGSSERQSKRLAVLERLFRCAHIVKSSSASVGLENLEKLAQTLEKLFKAALDGKLVLTVELIPLLCESAKAGQRLLNQEEVVGYEELLEKLKRIIT